MNNKKEYYNKRTVLATKNNPFAEEFCQTIKLGKKTTGYVNSSIGVINNQTGELLDTGSVIGTRKLVDKEEFIKWFGLGILATFDLPKSAQAVFKLIAHAYLQQNTTKQPMDRIYYNYQVAVEDFGYTKSKVTFNNGLNALMNSGFFAPIAKREGWLWININLMAKGDRVVLYNEYIVEGSETHRAVIERDKLDFIEHNTISDNQKYIPDAENFELL
jgi:hypothetical protein